MRFFMMLASLFMLGTGTFCIANSSVAIGSLAFIIGLVFCIVGACELFVLRGAESVSANLEKEYITHSVVMIIIGIAFLSGQLVDDNAVKMIFALWMSYDGARMIAEARLIIKDNSREENTYLVLALASLVVGVYMFFDSLFLNINTLALVGVCISILAIRKFRFSTEIEYKRPSFLTGNQEKLQEAEREEKKAMARAKAAIRESKELQRRIARIKADINEERRVEAAAKIAKHASDRDDK